MKSYMKKEGMRLAFVALLLIGWAVGILDASAVAMGGMVLSYETVAGATLACSVTPPSPDTTIAGFTTAIVYTDIGEITDLPGVSGRAYNMVEHAPIATRKRSRKKGSYSLEDITVVMAWDQSDAGQDLCRTAALDDSVLTFKLTKQGGDIRYFTAQVSKFIENMGTVDNVVQGQMTLLRQTDTVSDPA